MKEHRFAAFAKKTTKTTTTEPLPVPPFRMLCVMMHYVLDRLGPDALSSDLIDELKWEIARAHLSAPPPDHFAAVVDAVQLARAKGYLTPRGPR
jgi:hypothetical protein